MSEELLAVLRRLWALEHAIESLSRATLAAHGITGPQRFVLRLLGQQPGLTPGELARLLLVDPSSLTALLHRLEQRGLVRREPDALDHRRVHLWVTPLGDELAERPRGSLEAALTRTLAGLPPADRTVVHAWLERLAGEVEDERIRLSTTGT